MAVILFKPKLINDRIRSYSTEILYSTVEVTDYSVMPVVIILGTVASFYVCYRLGKYLYKKYTKPKPDSGSPSSDIDGKTPDPTIPDPTIPDPTIPGPTELPGLPEYDTIVRPIYLPGNVSKKITLDGLKQIMETLHDGCSWDYLEHIYRTNLQFVSMLPKNVPGIILNSELDYEIVYNNLLATANFILKNWHLFI